MSVNLLLIQKRSASKSTKFGLPTRINSTHIPQIFALNPAKKRQIFLRDPVLEASVAVSVVEPEP